MRRVWFIADPHFGHENIIKYTGRPFLSVDEMDEAIVSNYLKHVKCNDYVYFLGDIGHIEKHMSRLYGHKFLILGNHDRQSKEYYMRLGFMGVFEGVDISIGKTRVFLSHYPYRRFFNKISAYFHIIIQMLRKGRSFKQIKERLKREAKKFPKKHEVVLHGHIHEKYAPDQRNINCCVEVNDYCPVSSDYILLQIQKKS